jgi:hypothetical protein
MAVASAFRVILLCAIFIPLFLARGVFKIAPFGVS